MMTIADFLRQFPFLIALIVMVASELTKGLTEHIRTGSWHTVLFQPGGMPSTHSAFVTSVLILVGHEHGHSDGEFLLAFALACVVWYDAVTLRRSVGKQAEILNHLQRLQHLTERVGHSVKEVIAGILFGGVITGLLLGMF